MCFSLNLWSVFDIFRYVVSLEVNGQNTDSVVSVCHFYKSKHMSLKMSQTYNLVTIFN